MNSIILEHSLIILRGGGDLATGVALRLHRVGLKVVITELDHPLAVRRRVSFCEAVYQGKIEVEGVVARLVKNWSDATLILQQDEIPVMIDPNLGILPILQQEQWLIALVDARMTKKTPEIGMDTAPLVIGLGPGFIAGDNCHAAIETNRGHYLGRVIWDGAPEPDTGVPGDIQKGRPDRVLRAPRDGILLSRVEIGEQVKLGQSLALVSEQAVIAPFDGILRGLLHDGLSVKQGQKIGDLDPRNDTKLVDVVSEKSLAIGGGVLEALLTKPEIRSRLWN